MSKKLLDLGSLCRTCMSNRAKFSSGTTARKLKKCIYTKPNGRREGPTLMQLLQMVQPKIKVHAKDKLPKIMCRDCIEQLHMTYDFLQMCKDTDEKFRKMLKEYDTADYEEPSGLVDPVHGFVVDKEEMKESNVSTSHRRPEFEAMFVANWSDEEDDAMDFSDNPFGNDTDDEYDDGTSRETRKRKSLLKEHRNNTNKISKQETPHPNEDGTITCQECGKVLSNVTLWLEHIVEHSSTTNSEYKNSGIDKLLSLRKKFEKSDEDNKKIITSLKEELIAIKNEIKLIRNVPEEEDTSLLPPLPFQDLGYFEDFDARLPLEDGMQSQLKNVIRRVGGCDFPSYLRMAIKTIISDEMAINLTWRGTSEKPSIQRFTTFNLIKHELLSLKKKFEKTDEDNKKIITSLMEELITIKNEIKLIRNMPEEEDTSLLPPLPFHDLGYFEDFDARLKFEDGMRHQLKNVIRRVEGGDFPSYLRKAIRAIISDEMATNLTWRGTNEKPSIQHFNTFSLIKRACLSKFSTATDVDINKISQQHFVHAKDRLKKRGQKASTKEETV